MGVFLFFNFVDRNFGVSCGFKGLILILVNNVWEFNLLVCVNVIRLNWWWFEYMMMELLFNLSIMWLCGFRFFWVVFWLILWWNWLGFFVVFDGGWIVIFLDMFRWIIRVKLFFKWIRMYLVCFVMECIFCLERCLVNWLGNGIFKLGCCWRMCIIWCVFKVGVNLW